MTAIKFRISKHGEFLREETLSQPVIKIGKLSSSHLKLEDDSVSRMHAVIEITSGGDVSVIDLHSATGTLVNGQKVNKAKLQTGDQLTIGDMTVEVSIQSEAGAVAAPAVVAPAVVAPPPSAGLSAPAAPALMASPAVATASAPSFSAPTFAAPPGASAPPMGGGFGAVAIDAEEAGPQVVEVQAMLGNSMVGVKHSINPRAGKVTGMTKMLLAIGAVLLLASAATLFMGVSASGANHDSKTAWNAKDANASVQRKPHRWRPSYVEKLRPYQTTSSHYMFDGIYIGGLLGGLALLFWGLSRYRDEKVSPYFRIGSDKEVEFATKDSPAPSFALVAPEGDNFVFNFMPQMDGELTNEMGEATPLSSVAAQASGTQSGAQSFVIPPNSRTRVAVGNTMFYVASVNRPKKHPVPFMLFSDSQFNLCVAGVAGVVALIFGLQYWAGYDDNAGSLSGSDKEKYAMLDQDADKDQDDPLNEEEEMEDDSEEDPGGTGTQAALDEGLMGKKDSSKATGLFKMKNINDNPSLAKKEIMAQVTANSALGALSAGGQDMFASLTGLSDVSSGMDDDSIQGGLLGSEYGEAYGGFGLGKSGFGPGGGGTGWGTIGSGSQGLIGRGSGTGSGWGVGSGSGGGRGRKSKVPPVRIGSPTVSGDLDKATIRRYIRRKLPQIKYCYEKQLLTNSKLGGTVSTNFLIAPDGSVKSSSASGVGGKVSSCVAGIIKTIKFPKPRGGGLVQVRYPFRFNPPQ